MADDVAREVKTAVQALDGLNIGCADVVVSVEVKDGMLVVMGQGVVEGGSARRLAACSRPSRRRGQVRRRRRSHLRWSFQQHNVSTRENVSAVQVRLTGRNPSPPVLALG